MTISANGRALAIATKDLLLRWEETKQFWQDAKAADFEQEYLTQLQTAVDRATLASLIDQASTHLQNAQAAARAGDWALYGEEQKKLEAQAVAKGVSVIPDCGLAPGMVNILAAEGIRRLDRAEHPEPR